MDMQQAGWLVWMFFCDKERCQIRPVCFFFVADDKPVQEEDGVVCQHPECPERRRASKVRPFKLEGATDFTDISFAIFGELLVVGQGLVPKSLPTNL